MGDAFLKRDMQHRVLQVIFFVSVHAGESGYECFYREVGVYLQLWLLRIGIGHSTHSDFGIYPASVLMAGGVVLTV